MSDNSFQSIFTVEFEDFSSVKKKLEVLKNKLSNSNTSDIKVDINIDNINKIMQDITKLSKSNIQILPDGQIKVINTLNDELGKTIKLTNDLATGKTKIDITNNFEKQAKAEQALADAMAKGRENAELKKQQSIKKTEEAQARAMNKALEDSRKALENDKQEEINAKKLIEIEKEKLKIKQKNIELNRGNLVNSNKSQAIASGIDGLSGKTTKEVRDNVSNLNLELQRLDQNARLKGLSVGQKNVSSLGDAFKSTATKLGIFASTTLIIRELSLQLKEASRYIIELDTNLTNIMMITGKSASQVKGITNEFKALGEQLHTTNREIMNSSEEILRAGYDTQTSKKMLEASVIGAKVSGQTSQQVTEQLIAIKNAFNMTGDELMIVIDKMAEMDRTSATSFQELAEATKRTAYSAQEMGTSYEDLLAYITTVSEKTRKSADTIGESFKSIYSRYANIKLGNMDDEGKSINDVEKALGRLDIKLRDGVDSFRDFDDVLKEFMDKVKSGSVSQIDKFAVINALAGTRQKETLLALVENTEALAKHQKDLANSTGMAKEMFDEAYSNSLDARINDLQRSFEGLYESILNSSTLKFGLDISTGTINGISTIINKLGLLPTVVTGVVGAMTLFNTKFRQSSSFLSQFALGVTGLQPKIDALNAKLQHKAKVLIDANKGAGDSTTALSAKLSLLEGQLAATTIKMALLKAGTLLLQTAMTMGISLAVTGAMTALFKLGDSIINAKSNLKEFNDEFINSSENNNTNSAQKLIDKYKSLSDQLKVTATNTEEYKTKEEELKTTLDELIQVYPNAVTYIEKDSGAKLLNAEATQKAIDANIELAKSQANKVLDKNDMYSVTSAEKLVQNYEEAKRKLEELNNMAANGVETTSVNGVQRSIQGEIDRTSEKFSQYESAIRASLPALKLMSEENSSLTDVYDVLESAIGDTSNELDSGTGSVDSYGDSLNDLQGDIQTTADKLKDMADEFDSLGSDIDILTKALDEFSENGILSRDTASKILNSGDSSLISLLNDQNSFLEKGNELLGVKQQLQQETLNSAIDLANTEMGLSNQVAQTFTEDELVKINSALQANKSIVESTAEATSINLKNYNIDSENKVLAEMAKLKSVSAFVNSNDEATASMVNQLADKYGIDVENYKNSINEKIRLLNSWIHTATYDINRVVQASGKSLWTNNPYKDQMELAEKYASTVSSAYNKISVSGGKVGIGDIGSSGSGGKGSGSSSAQKQQEDIESLTDRYYILQNALTDVENALKSLDTKMENATEEEKIKLLDQEIALLNKKRKALNDIWYEQKQEKNDLQYTLSQNGFQFDSEGNITNYKKRLNELLAWANGQSDAEAKKSAQDTYKNLVKIVDDYTKLIKDSIPDTINQFDDITNAIIDSQKEISDILQKQREEYVKNLEKETDALKNELQKRKDLINKQWKTEDEEDERAEKQDKINQLEADLASAIRTGDEALQKSIRDQLRKAQDELNKFITETERETINNRFDEEMNKLDEDLQNKIDMIESQLGDEDLLSLVQSGVRDLSSALNNIDSSTKNVNRSFAYVGDTVNNIGDIIGNTWGNNLDKVIEKAKELVGVLSSDLSLNTNNIPTTKTSNSGNTIQVDVGDINIPGLTKDEFNREWDKKGNELYNEIMKQFNR